MNINILCDLTPDEMLASLIRTADLREFILMNVDWSTILISEDLR